MPAISAGRAGDLAGDPAGGRHRHSCQGVERGAGFGLPFRQSPQPIGKIRSEIRRYFVMPGQATAYEVGMQRILALREQARTAMGARYDQRGFHDMVLGEGSVPLPVLEAQVARWIGARAG